MEDFAALSPELCAFCDFETNWNAHASVHILYIELCNAVVHPLILGNLTCYNSLPKEMLGQLQIQFSTSHEKNQHTSVFFEVYEEFKSNSLG